MGYDFPYQTLEYLKLRQQAHDESEQVKALCADISVALQGRLEELDALPDLKEYHCSSVKALRLQRERKRQMNEAMEDASKESIWRQIATRIPLKAGTRMFYLRESSYSDPMELKGISHSVALPKSEITDPAGAARERLLFRKATRELA